MRRREFIAGIGSAAWPVGVRAPVITNRMNANVLPAALIVRGLASA
jgi:hypothetical protein